MMRRLAVLGMLVACHHGAHRGAHPAATASVASGSSIVAVTIWPARWSRVAAALAPVVDSEVPLGASPWQLAREGASQIGLGALELPPPGIDPQAPVSIEVFAAPARFEQAALTALGSNASPRATVAARIRITFGATDPARLAAAVRTAIEAGPRSSELGLHVVLGASAVALDITIPDATAVGADPASPAVAFQTDAPSAARVLVRPGQLRDLASNLQMIRVLRVLPQLRPDERHMILAEGISEILSGYLVMDPGSSLSYEAMVDIPADAARSPQVAFALTPAGAKTLAAAGLARGASAPLGTLHWQDAIGAAPSTPFLDALPRRDERDGMQAVATVFHECGASCFLYLATSPGFGLELAKAAHVTDFGELFGPEANALTLAAAQQATWSGDLFVVHAPGAASPSWRPEPPPAPASDADRCYRRALVTVRAALRAAAEVEPANRAAVFGQARAALEGAVACTAADPEIAARRRAMAELVGALASGTTP